MTDRLTGQIDRQTYKQRGDRQTNIQTDKLADGLKTDKLQIKSSPSH